MNGIDTWNAWLDQMPRATIWASGRAVPAFRAIGVVGAHVAIAIATTTALVLGLSLLVAVGMIATVTVSFFGWALARKWVTRRENLVLLEHTWLTVAVVGAYATWLDEPIWQWLDVTAVGASVFLAFGRIGCLVAGCCHGAPSGFGIVYPSGPSGPSGTHPLSGIRLFPVQLVEAAALSVIAVAGFVMAIATPEGTAIIAVAAAYAVIRFGTEGLRADHRPTISRGLALVQLIAACIADELRTPGPFDVSRGIVPALSLVAIGLVVMLWRRPAPLPAEIIEDVRTFVDDAAPTGNEPIVHRVHRSGCDVTVAVSEQNGSRHVSISAPARRVGVAARVSALALGRPPDVVSPTGVAHTVVDLRRELDGDFLPSQRHHYFGSSSSPSTPSSSPIASMDLATDR